MNQKMKRIGPFTLLLFYLFAFSPITASAQKIIPEKTVIEVGRTGWQQPITAVFEFRNKGSRRLRIEQVLPDCSCTQLDYPKGDLGDRFRIRMTYDARQLGHFDKQAGILFTGMKKPLYLTMRGVVLEHYVDLSKDYPVAMGDLCLSGNYLEFDDVHRGDMQRQELRIYNNSMRDYHPYLMHLPEWLSATMSPERLPAGETGVITVTLNSSKLRDYGLTQTTLYLAGNPGDKAKADHEVGVSAVLLPAFSDDASPATTPRIQLSSETVDIDFDGKSKKTEVIVIENMGQAQLHISSLQMFTGGLKISLDRSRIDVGESARLKVTALRNELQNVRTRPRILMITNDPKKPKVTININAH
jgi:hypothetical protein